MSERATVVGTAQQTGGITMTAKQIDAFITERVTFKNFKLNQSLSDETPAYSATIFVDGVKAGTSSNRGHGGPDNMDFTADGAIALQEVADENDCSNCIEVLLHTLVWQNADSKIAARRRKKGFAITVFFGQCCGDYTSFRSMKQLDEVLAANPGASVYRVIGEDFTAVEHADLTAMIAAYPMGAVRSKMPPVCFEDGWVSFVHGEVEHSYRNAACSADNLRSMFKLAYVARGKQLAAA